jgi:hypothetical protein
MGKVRLALVTLGELGAISRNLPPSMPVGGNFSDFVDASLETCLGPAQELHLY